MLEICSLNYCHTYRDTSQLFGYKLKIKWLTCSSYAFFYKKSVIMYEHMLL